MDKTVIDEMFAEDGDEGALRHGEEEIRDTAAAARGRAEEALERLRQIKEELSGMKDSFQADADALQDLYDDLDFVQQSGSGEALSDLSDECGHAVDDLETVIDDLSDLLLFRFKA
ncbi:MAG: hypothetical protein IK115_07210 [Lachnospiraceae bacterium]|nr:hypothetical protein [Lachnospiraceae bacterium]